MPSKPTRWPTTGADKPIVPTEFEIDVLLADEDLVQITGCRVKLTPFVEKNPLSEINQVFEAAHSGALKRRVVLVPASQGDLL